MSVTFTYTHFDPSAAKHNRSSAGFFGNSRTEISHGPGQAGVFRILAVGRAGLGRAGPRSPLWAAGFGVSSSSVPDPFMKVPSHFGHFFENFKFFTPGFVAVTCGLVIQCYHHSTDLPMGALPADPVQVRRPVLYH